MIGALTAGEPVVVRRVTPDGSWYVVETPGGVIGWVSGSLLTVAPEIAAQLPRGTTDEAVAVRPTAPIPLPVPPPAAGGGTGGSFDPIGEDCPEDAPIKGNINSSGEYIYHSPGQQAYIRTIPEQCFATSAQATAAGFRPAQR